MTNTNWRNRLGCEQIMSHDELNIYVLPTIDGHRVNSLGELGDFIDQALKDQKAELLEEVEKMKKKPTRYIGKATINADFSRFGGKVIKVGDENEFTSILSKEDEGFNDCLEIIKGIIEKK